MEPSTLTGLDWATQGVAVAAVLTVVGLFLRHMRTSHDQIKDLGESCHRAQRQSQEAFERSLDRIVQSNESTATMQAAQVDRLIASNQNIETKLTELASSLAAERR